MGSLLNKKWPRNRIVLTEAKLDDIGAILKHSAQKSVKKLARQTGVPVSSARNAAHLLHLEPYHCTPVYALKEFDSIELLQLVFKIRGKWLN